MRKIVFLVLAIVSIIPLTTDVFAQAEQPISLTFFSAQQITSFKSDPAESAFLKAINQDHYLEEDNENFSANKLGDGMTNSLTSWTDIPKEVAEKSAENNILIGMTYGLGVGIASSVTRGVAGAYDLATYSIAPAGQPLMESEYKIDNPEQDGFKVSLLKW